MYKFPIIIDQLNSIEIVEEVTDKGPFNKTENNFQQAENCNQISL